MWITLTTISWILVAVLAQNKPRFVDGPNITQLPDRNHTRGMCPREFEQIDENCYHISKRKANWDSADAHCRSKNSKIVEPLDAVADRKLRMYIMSPRFKQVELWIGARYDPAKSTWVWGTTGQQISYDGFWKKRFKKNLNWHCAVTNPKRNNGWAPRLCHRRRKYICRMPVGDVPSTLSKLQTAHPRRSKTNRKMPDRPKPQATGPPSSEPIKTLEQDTDGMNEIPLSERRDSRSRSARKSRFPSSRNSLEMESQRSSNTRWAPGTKHSDRLQLMKTQNSNEPDQWITKLAASTPQNKKIVDKVNHEESLIDNHTTGPKSLAEEPGDALLETNTLLHEDLFESEILLQTLSK